MNALERDVPLRVARRHAPTQLPQTLGTHLMADLYGASSLDDVHAIRRCLLVSVKRAGATLLHIHLHRSESGGVSGVAVLAESHISIHTWPEDRYAAVDAFMCGTAVPSACIEVLRAVFRPEKIVSRELARGVLN